MSVSRNPWSPPDDVPCPTPFKRRWAAKEAADEALDPAARHGVALRPYLCRCGWWHHTSKVTKKERRKRLRLRDNRKHS